MKTRFIEVLKGFVVGMGMLAPGLSGGVFAVTLGIYPRIMKGIASLFTQPTKVIRDLFWIGIGGVLGFLVTFILILQLIAWLPLPFTFLFIGFIIGAIPDVTHKIKNDGKIWLKALFFVLFFALVTVLPFLNVNETEMIAGDLLSQLLLVLVGFILAGTLIIPGISGSLVLMALGYYTYLLNLGRDLATSVLAFDITSLLNGVWPLLFTAIGFVIGLLVFSKMINYLLQRQQSLLYTSVLGLLLASPFSIFLEAVNAYPNLNHLLWLMIPLSILTLIGGVVIAKTMAKLEEKVG
ncbi:MAG: undecaprenyl phosphate translocase family protein [Bacilli bacterium]